MDDLLSDFSSYAYEKSHDRRNELASKHGWQHDSALSGDDHAVFHKAGKAVVAYRGTDPSNSDDLKADLAIAGGHRKHKRFDDGLNASQAAIDKYGNNVSFTGHSLGGSLALHAYEKHGNPTTVFNPGSSLLFEKKLKLHKSGNKTRIIRHADDLVSAGHRNQSAHEVVTHGKSNKRKSLFETAVRAVTSHGLDSLKEPEGPVRRSIKWLRRHNLLS